MIKLIIKDLGLEKPALAGFDWGASIVLKMGCAKFAPYSKIIAFHPTLTKGDKFDSKSLKVKTLIQWCKQDMDYNLNSFKSLIRGCKNISPISGIINPKSLLWKGVFKKMRWDANDSYNTYEICSDKVTVPIIHFLTGVNPTKTSHKGGDFDVRIVLDESGKRVK